LVLVFGLLLRRPLSPTPLPYTTLFRSGNQHDGNTAVLRRYTPLLLHQRAATGKHHHGNGIHEEGNHDVDHYTQSRPANQIQTLLDRKSTRLNSSHVKSSYAVFCLKKKT